MVDHISDMLIRIKNAGLSGHEEVRLPYSKMKERIAETLKRDGFIKDWKEGTTSGKKALRIELFVENRVPKIRDVKRLSKPSKRIYKGASELRPFKSGYGMFVLSTPLGIMSGRDAKKAGVGGEVLFSIW